MADESNDGGSDLYPAGADERGERPISPTDVSQFIRLDQCQRYLRLRLHERIAGRRFLRDYGVAPQPIQPLLTRTGARFEEEIERAVRAQYATMDLTEGVDPTRRGDDNARVIGLARDLAAGEVLVLLQPRLQVSLGGWRMTGDADVLRLERDGDGCLRVLIVDIKSSRVARVEHRLQVAFYHEMLEALFAGGGVDVAAMETAILYRGAATAGDVSAEDARRAAAEREAAARLFGLTGALLELVEAPEDYRAAVRDLVTGPRSLARGVVDDRFETVPYHLTYKCDGCLYNEFCMKWSAKHDDLSLLSHLSEREKGALQRAGIGRVAQVASLKEPIRTGVNGRRQRSDEPGPGSGPGGSGAAARGDLAGRPATRRADSPGAVVPPVERGPDRRPVVHTEQGAQLAALQRRDA